MKNFIILFLVFWCSNVHAREIFIRPLDGGTQIVNGVGECDGSKDAAKSADKKCAYKEYSSEVGIVSKDGDQITLGGLMPTQEKPVITVKLSNVYATSAQYAKDPEKYKKMIRSGKRVFIDQSFELSVRK
jgi:hypothetical protein